MLNPGHYGGPVPPNAYRTVDIGYGRTRPCNSTGTSTNAGYPEHTFTWDVAVRTKALLESRGITVLLTRDNDTQWGRCVDERTRAGNRADISAVVSIHADGAAASGHGFHICEDTHQPGGAVVAGLSHKLTVALHDSLLASSGYTVSNYLGTNGYFPRDDLAGLNLATRPATFMELGNMRNAGDAAMQSSPSGRQRLSQSIADGIIAFLAA